MKTLTIDPITRLEGHGKIDIFLDDEGQVANAYLVIPELRGFEKFCEGRPVEELPRLTSKICGVCPEAHHLAGTKAVDMVYHVDPPPAAKKLRELFYAAHYVHSHIAHFYALAAPDFVVGPDAPASERNILGVVAKVGAETGKEVIRHRAYAQGIQQLIGGRATAPVCGLPGGCSKPITEADRLDIEEKAVSCADFAQFSLGVFEDVVLKDPRYLDLVLSEDTYHVRTYYMGLVDGENRVSFYDGDVRIVGPDGSEYARFGAADYLQHIAEHVEPWSYMKFAFLKNVGWRGISVGSESGVARVGPLARLNAAEGMATPLAQAEYERLYATLGGKPVHHTLAYHWARLVEMLSAAERMVELARDEEITSPDVRVLPTAEPTEGVGIVEAPRGTLIHHYKTDRHGMVTGLNLIVATGLNYGAMCASVTKAAKSLIRDGEVTDGLLNRVEMAFRAYDPCMSCATHAMPGHMPLVLRFRALDGTLIRSYRRD